MRASTFDWLLMNLRGLFPSNALNYLPRDEALQRLRNLTGSDFGYDCIRWAEYGERNDLCYLRWSEHSELLRTPGDGADRTVAE